MGIIKKMRQEENNELSELNRRRGTYAFGRYIPMSAQKAQRVINQIRGRSYEEAFYILGFMPYKACDPIFKVIDAAAANAEYEKGYDKRELFIKKIEVNKGTKRTKLKPRAQGRNSIIKRYTCHITVVLQHQFLMKDLKKKRHTFSKKNMQDVWATANYSTLRKFDDIAFKLIMRGELNY